MNRIKYFFIALLGVAATMGCSSANGAADRAETPQQEDKVVFDGDSAYAYVAKQCEFGPRVPNTAAHKACGEWLVSELSKRGKVTTQDVTLDAFDGTKLEARNIICEINPDTSRRVLLLAHWDCRPWADNDPNPAKRKEPVMGANDGASGVGVLLEAARVLSQKCKIGVDILLVDAEDWGDSEGDSQDSWALGTQYWVKNMHRPNYRPMFGILLDMVGTKNAEFRQEYFSMLHAQQICDIVWREALQSGYSRYFTSVRGGGITDDHYFVNEAGIPCIDIIDQNSITGTGFFEQWHTTDDTMTHISAETLKAAGQTVVNVVMKY